MSQVNWDASGSLSSVKVQTSEPPKSKYPDSNYSQKMSNCDLRVKFSFIYPILQRLNHITWPDGPKIQQTELRQQKEPVCDIKPIGGQRTEQDVGL